MGVIIINAVISSPAYSFSILKNIFFVFFFQLFFHLMGRTVLIMREIGRKKKLVQVKTFGRENEALEPQLEEMKFI